MDAGSTISINKLRTRLHDSMRIWHVGASASARSVNGVNVTIWRIASAQAALGHEIHLPVLNATDDDGFAPELIRHVVPSGLFRFEKAALFRLLDRALPDIVHIHSSFVPRHTQLGKFLRARSIPYVLTPHGGLLPQVLRRDRSKKLVYSLLFEKPFVRGASGVTSVTPHELDFIGDFAKPASLRGRWVLNPVSPEIEDAGSWIGSSGRPYILFLGRFDTFTKGLDRLLEIARLLPEADFHLFGRSPSKRDAAVLKRGPSNVSIHEPVYGPEKVDILRRATLYIQPSRWEAFSISVAEALAVGLPCALTETLHQADLLRREGAAFPMSENPAVAASQLRGLLGDTGTLAELSSRGRRFARRHLVADGIAQSYIDFYRTLLGRPPLGAERMRPNGRPSTILQPAN